jgi:hypothetical protein
MFGENKFDVENAFNMYATDAVTIPAEWIHEKEFKSNFTPYSQGFHIYMIGFVKGFTIEGVSLDRPLLKVQVRYNDELTLFEIEVPNTVLLSKKDDKWYVFDGQHSLDLNLMQLIHEHLSSKYTLSFHVKYIGQAYGVDGSRKAHTRLENHNKLQEIAIRGAPEGYKLAIIMLKIEDGNRVITMFNPQGKIQDINGERIDHGLEMMKNTSESERISLYEAGLIRYFKPDYNVEFKNSFPSTNMKLLKKCYEKDFAAIVCEVCFDDLPYNLCSDTVEVNKYHCAIHHLHNDDDRKAFFFE